MKKVWTDEEEDFIEENYTMTAEYLRVALEDQFGTKHTTQSVKAKRISLGLRIYKHGEQPTQRITHPRMGVTVHRLI